MIQRVETTHDFSRALRSLCDNRELYMLQSAMTKNGRVPPIVEVMASIKEAYAYNETLDGRYPAREA